MYKLIAAEARQAMKGYFSLILTLAAFALTYLNGDEFLRRESVSSYAEQAGMTLAQEWTYRITTLPMGMYLLAVGVFVWYRWNRDRNTMAQPLVFSKSTPTAVLGLSRSLAVALAASLCYIAGMTAAAAVLAFQHGTYPDSALFAASLFMNVIPALAAWCAVAVFFATVFRDLKAYAFPLGVLWFVLSALPASSIAWSYRVLANPLAPLQHPYVWLHLLYPTVLSFASLSEAIVLVARERSGRVSQSRRHRVGRFRLASNPHLGLVMYHVKTAVGWRWLAGTTGAMGLASILFGPWGIGKGLQGPSRIYFPLAISELLFPLFGLMVGAGLFLREEKVGMSELWRQRPRFLFSFLQQKALGLMVFFGGVCIGYLTVLKLFLPEVPIWYGFITVFPSMFFITSLATTATVLTGKIMPGYVGAGIYWFAAYYLEETFPWFLSPVYHLAEYSFKLKQNLFLPNKLSLMLLACLMIYSAARAAYRRMVE